MIVTLARIKDYLWSLPPFTPVDLNSPSACPVAVIGNTVMGDTRRSRDGRVVADIRWARLCFEVGSVDVTFLACHLLDAIHMLENELTDSYVAAFLLSHAGPSSWEIFAMTLAS